MQSCENKTEKKNKNVIKQTSEIVADDKQNTLPIKNDYLINMPIKVFPITDSTTFDNFEEIGVSDNSLPKRIKFESGHIDSKNFRLNYKVPFSQNFTSIVITYQNGDNELFTTLVNLNEENEVIDQIDIAYDEIAESAFQKTSTIYQDKIVITDWNWMYETSETETITYILQSDGKFKPLKSEKTQQE